MASILRKLPFYEDSRTLRVPGGPVLTIKHHQIIVWVSITLPEIQEFSPNALRIPAILDIGFNDTFLIREDHFCNWAKLSPTAFAVVDFLSVYGKRAPLIDADLWLHRNVPGTRDQFLAKTPFRLEISSGIAVSNDLQPRLPLLGMLALRQARLQLQVDFDKCRVNLAPPRRYWFFG